MSLNYKNATKAARLAAVHTQLKLGSGPGKLRVYTASYATLLYEIPLDETDGNGADNILALLASPVTVDAVGAGNANIAKLTDSDNTEVADGLTVGTSGTDIIVDNVNTAVGQDVTINALTITA